MRAIRSAAGCLSVCALVAACAESQEGAQAPRAAVVDEARGALRGVRLGVRPAAMHRVFGPKEAVTEDDADARAAPLEGETISGNVVYPGPYCRGMPIYRYERAAFGFHCGKLLWILTNEPGAETARGVAVGDPLRKAQAAYPQAYCGEVGGGEWAEEPVCTAEVGKARFIAFGGDPIVTIQLASVRIQDVH